MTSILPTVIEHVIVYFHAARRAGANVVAAGEAGVGVALVEAVTASENIDNRAALVQRDAVRRRWNRSSPPGDCRRGAWSGYTPDSLRREMLGYAHNALAKRLHAIGIEMAV